MIFFIILFVLLIISFLWSLYSLRKERRGPEEVEHVKKELEKEKILFKK